jgi:hypothetical protein
MLLPSKITTFHDSILSKLPLVLYILMQDSNSVSVLFDKMKGNVKDVVEYLDILDCLYALGKINYNPETRLIDYVG